jgi:hypothetical protein
MDNAPQNSTTQQPPVTHSAQTSSFSFKMFTPLSAPKDYLETLKNATYKPVLQIFMGLGSIALTFYKMALGLAVLCGLKKDTGASYPAEATWTGVIGVCMIIGSIMQLVVSLISLLTRPVVTLFTGCKSETEAGLTTQTDTPPMNHSLTPT